MNQSFYLFACYFFIYSFLGWCLEIAYAAVKERKFLNRGVLNGPLCPVYGFAMLLMLTFYGGAKINFIFLTIGCSVIATLLEFFTGELMERLFRKRWWDYSDKRFNIGGYVCLPFSALWGVLSALTLTFIQPLIHDLVAWVPSIMGQIVIIAGLALFAADLLSVLGIAFQVHRYGGRMEELAEGMQDISNRLGRAIFTHIEKRMMKAHPVLTKEPEISAAETGNKVSEVFADGCSFHKLVWLFFIGAFLGDVTETVFMYATTGRLMSRSSVVYGPFSIVWGLGMVILTMMLHPYRDRDDRYIFLFGTVVGGAYEYICSVFTELAFGTVFWDYSKIPFNLGGRINLLYCFFWGFAAVVWIKILYPRVSGLIERVPKRIGTVISWCLVAFMSVNITISALALARYSDRSAGKEAANSIDTFLDSQFSDERMDRIYPGAIMK